MEKITRVKKWIRWTETFSYIGSMVVIECGIYFSLHPSQVTVALLLVGMIFSLLSRIISARLGILAMDLEDEQRKSKKEELFQRFKG